MKLLVISLGVVLIGGTIAMFGAIASKAARAPLVCKDAKIDLQHKGVVMNITPAGDTVQVTLATPPETKILTVDRCSGKLLQTLTIAP